MLLRKTSFGLRVLVAAGLLTLGLASAGQAETLKIGGTVGGIDISSEEGRGTRVILWLPMHREMRRSP